MAPSGFASRSAEPAAQAAEKSQIAVAHAAVVAGVIESKVGFDNSLNDLNSEQLLAHENVVTMF